ncbi:MAG: cell wall hydrolase [Clostridiales bacterium]|nr:cell wall hydrolase [Clostridiales bacterium]
MIREINEFLRYVIDPGKVKALILLIQSVALLMLIGCRVQQGYDQARYEAEAAELVAAHDAEIKQITAKAEAGIYATQYLSSAYEGDAWKVAQWLDCLDARYHLTDEAKALACWVVFNRVESSEYPDNVDEVLWQKGQFCEFSDAEPPTEGNFTIATNQLSRFYNGDIRPVPSTAVFIAVSSEGVVLRDSWEETAKTQHWRA